MAADECAPPALPAHALPASSLCPVSPEQDPSAATARPPPSLPGFVSPPSSVSPAMSQAAEVHIPLAEYLALTRDHPPSPPPSFNWSFTQGLLLGQFSVLLIIGAFIKFFVFGPSPVPFSRSRSQSRPPLTRNISVLNRKRSSILRPAAASTTGSILSKTLYNVHAHQPESLDWFNVLVAQTIAQFRADAARDDALLATLDALLNSPQKPDFLGRIDVSEVALGEDFPIFSNCRITPAGENRLRARMDVDLSDVLTLGIQTQLMLNWPRPLVAVLPVALAVSVLRFSGTLNISFVPTSQGTAAMAFSFDDDYRLDVGVRSLLGGRSRLTDVPKIAQLVESRLHAWIDERCVEPRFQQIALPSLWPRKKNTRQEGKDGDAAVVDDPSDLVMPPQPNGRRRFSVHTPV